MKETDLLKILLDERNYHATHPNEVINKFIYSLGGALATIVAGFVFKDKIGILQDIVNSSFFIVAIFLLVAGYIFIFVALAEHSRFHKLQLTRLENAIEYIIKPNTGYTYELFWEKYGEKLLVKDSLEIPVKLIAKEPDIRKGFHFHDKKIEIGIYLILTGVISLLSLIIRYSIHRG